MKYCPNCKIPLKKFDGYDHTRWWKCSGCNFVERRKSKFPWIDCSIILIIILLYVYFIIIT